MQCPVTIRQEGPRNDIGGSQDATKRHPPRPRVQRRLPSSMPWTPYADVIYAVLSSSALLLFVWLVLRPQR